MRKDFFQGGREKTWEDGKQNSAKKSDAAYLSPLFRNEKNLAEFEEEFSKFTLKLFFNNTVFYVFCCIFNVILSENKNQ